MKRRAAAARTLGAGALLVLAAGTAGPIGAGAAGAARTRAPARARPGPAATEGRSRRCRTRRKHRRARSCRHHRARPAPRRRGRPPTRPVSGAVLGVHEHEFRITLTRGSVPSGRVLIELINEGEDRHDLQVAPADLGRPVASFETLASGQRAVRTVALAPGTYRLWCSLPGHQAAGMDTLVAVG